MKTHGMQQAAIQTVFCVTTLSKLTYCFPTWWGYITAGDRDRDRVEGFLRRCKHFGLHDPSSPSFAQLCEQADNRLFNCIVHNFQNVLHSILPEKTEFLILFIHLLFQNTKYAQQSAIKVRNVCVLEHEP
jgi:hypothetical protein